jgi:hypothetical protein
MGEMGEGRGIRGSGNESKHVEGMLAVKEDAGVATRRGMLYSLFRK